jgi:hypothetical protein
VEKSLESKVAYEILAYLAEHPDSQDTREGIMEWWLLERHINRETAKVKEALSELVDLRFVLERKRNNFRTYYRINQRKFREVQKLLRQRR